MTDTTAGAPETAPEATEAPDPVAALAKEAADLKDRLLRTLAEMENLRRRTARDVHDARAYAVANFARDMLSVSDNLRRALDAMALERGEHGALRHFDALHQRGKSGPAGRFRLRRDRLERPPQIV